MAVLFDAVGIGHISHLFHSRHPVRMLMREYMGLVKMENGDRRLPGYSKRLGRNRQKTFKFVCSNTEYGCAFSSESNPLPLHVIDDVIYEVKPTLLLGTVDKFAMLPFRPAAQGLFGYYDGEKVTSPDLIIQDELHLISGPLGSMVGSSISSSSSGGMV